MKNYQYQLTDSARQLANFIEGTHIDEEKQILYSDQNLNELGLEAISIFPKTSIQYSKEKRSYIVVVFLLLYVLFNYCLLFVYQLLLKVFHFIPFKKLKKLTSSQLEKNLPENYFMQVTGNLIRF